MKKNMLIRIVSLLCVVACLFAFASCHEDLATKEELNNATTTNKTDLTEAQKALYEAMDAVKATADAAATKAALEEVKAALETVKGTSDAAATQEALENALASLAEVKATADAAATQTALNELKASLEAAIAAVKTTADAAATQAALEAAIAAADKANTYLKTELDAKIEANTTLIGTKVTELQAAIDAVKATADAAATKEALDAAVADITADLEAVKTTADAAATKTALDAVIADLAAVKTTADAAATKTALDAVIADLAAVKGTSDAAATKVALDAAIAEINAVKSTYATKAELEEVSTLLATVKNTADAAATKEALTAAQAALNDALAAANTNIAANAEAINGIKESIKTLATAENLAAVNAELANVKATADAAQTAEEVAAAIEAAIADLKLDNKIAAAEGKIDAAKTELNGKITALEEDLKAKISANDKEIENLWAAVGALSGDPEAIEELNTKLTNLENAIAEIKANNFKDEYVSLTDKLLSDEYEYSYAKFIALYLQIEGGAYDPEELQAAKERAEEILFELSRIVKDEYENEDGSKGSYIKDLYDELYKRVDDLTPIEESLRNLIADITVIDTSSELAEIMKKAKKLVEKMEYHDIPFTDLALKADFETKYAAWTNLNDIVAAAKANIDAKMNAFKNRDVLLNSEDAATIAGVKTAIKALCDAFKDSVDSGYYEYYKGAVNAELYKAVFDEIVEEKQAVIYANLYATAINEYLKNATEKYIAANKNTYIADAYNKLLDEAIKSEKAKYLLANPEATEDEALTAATAIVNASQAILTKIDADSKLEENWGKFADDDIATENGKKAIEKLADDAITAKAFEDATAATTEQETYIRALAEMHYDESFQEAVFARYDLMLAAKADATTIGAILENKTLTVVVKNLINKWYNNGLRYDDTTPQDYLDVIDAWTKNAEKYNGKVEEYKNAYAFYAPADYAISDANRDIILGNIDNVANYEGLTTVKNFVAAIKGVYEKNVKLEQAGVPATIVVYNAKVGAAITGNVEINGELVLAAIKAIADFDNEVYTASGENDGALAINKNLMIPAHIRNVLTDNDALNSFVSVVEAKNSLDALITQINAAFAADPSTYTFAKADNLAQFRTDINKIYKNVSDAQIPEYPITSVNYKAVEDAFTAAQAKFQAFAQLAINAYNTAKQLINDIRAAGKIGLDHGYAIYYANNLHAAARLKFEELSSNTPLTLESGEIVYFAEVETELKEIVEDYKKLAREAAENAEEIAQTLSAEIEAIKNYDAKKLNNYKVITDLYNKLVNDYVKKFFSAENVIIDNYAKMLAAQAKGDALAAPEADAYKTYLAAANDLGYLACAIKVTETVSVPGKPASYTYDFVTFAEFETLRTLNTTAVATYADAEGVANGWKNKVDTLAGNFSFHDWDTFKTYKSEYEAFVAKYYEENKFVVDVDWFSMIDKYNNVFMPAYDACEDMVDAKTTKLNAVISAVEALGGFENITTALIGDAYAKKLADAKAAIDAFVTDLCADAKTDGDLVVDGVDYYLEYTKCVAGYNFVKFAAELEDANHNKYFTADDIDNGFYPSQLSSSLVHATSEKDVKSAYKYATEYVCDEAEVVDYDVIPELKF